MAHIEIYTGLPGSGKTLQMMTEILDTWIRGGIVATNIEMNWSYCKRYCRRRGWQLGRDQYVYLHTEEQLKKPYLYLPKGSDQVDNLLCLDEMATLSPARQWTKTENEFVQYLIFIRRMKHRVIMATQRISMIDKQFRLMYQFRTNFNNLSRGLRVPFLGYFPWQLLIRVVYDQQDERISVTPYTVNTEVAKCYNTLQEHAKFSPEHRQIKRKAKNLHVEMVARFRLMCLCIKRMFSKSTRTDRAF